MGTKTAKNDSQQSQKKQKLRGSSSLILVGLPGSGKSLVAFWVAETLKEIL
jgi:adenylylsulfate kinase-like enzyme